MLLVSIPNSTYNQQSTRKETGVRVKLILPTLINSVTGLGALYKRDLPSLEFTKEKILFIRSY